MIFLILENSLRILFSKINRIHVNLDRFNTKIDQFYQNKVFQRTINNDLKIHFNINFYVI